MPQTAEALTLSLILPRPPGVNNLYMPVRTRTGAKIILTQEARAWADRAAYLVRNQRAGQKIPHYFRVHILIPNNNFDSDAPIKEIIDACQHGGAVANDKLCRGGTWDFDDTREGDTILVELVALPGEAPEPKRKKALAKNSTDG